LVENNMDVRTEQVYQRRITELTRQLAERDATIVDLRAQVADMSAKVAALTEQVADLLAQVARLSKNSSNSSKPPSSDIVKPPPPPLPPGEKRSIGGQKGHPRHEREPFTPAQINQVVNYRINRCPNCGRVVRPTDLPPRKLQQVEIPEIPVAVTEHRSHGYFCPHCQKVHYAQMPKEVQNSGLVGPRLTAWIAYLKGVCHASFSTIRRFCRDVLHLPISRGQLAKVIHKASMAMAPSHHALLKMLPRQAVVNTDETGHKTNGQPHWTWGFRAEFFTLFQIDRSRGSQVLRAVLGEDFAGIVGCDYFSAYHKYRKQCGIFMQFCLAHLIRDVKFLAQVAHGARHP
jgi:transposase